MAVRTLARNHVYCASPPPAYWIDALLASNSTPTAKLVGFVIANRAGALGEARIVPADLIETTRLSRNTLYLAIHHLERRGLVELVRSRRQITAFRLVLPSVGGAP